MDDMTLDPESRIFGGRTPDDPRAVYRYYMFIWKLFYAELIAFPLACLLAG